MMKRIDYKKIVNGIFIGFLAAILAIYAIMIIVMFVWAAYTSFKSSIAYSMSSYKFPKKWIVSNYTIAFRDLKIPVSPTKNVGVPLMVLYSFVYTIGCAVISTIVPCVVAYCAARYDYKFSKILYSVVVIVMTLPVIGSQVSELAILQKLNLYDTFIGIFILKFNFLGLYFLVFYATFKALPNTYAEAAHIDGASDFVVFFKIMLPLVMNTCFIVFMLVAINYWNDITISRIYLPSYPTFAYGLLYFATTPGSLPLSSSGVPVRVAACMLLVIPMLIAFLLFHKKMMGNLTMGGIKG